VDLNSKDRRRIEAGSCDLPLWFVWSASLFAPDKVVNRVVKLLALSIRCWLLDRNGICWRQTSNIFVSRTAKCPVCVKTIC